MYTVRLTCSVAFSRMHYPHLGVPHIAEPKNSLVRVYQRARGPSNHVALCPGHALARGATRCSSSSVGGSMCEPRTIRGEEAFSAVCSDNAFQVANAAVTSERRLRAFREVYIWELPWRAAVYRACRSPLSRAAFNCDPLLPYRLATSSAALSRGANYWRSHVSTFRRRQAFTVRVMRLHCQTGARSFSRKLAIATRYLKMC